MTDEINARIAEFLEPKPTEWTVECEFFSPLGAWERNAGTPWRPADFLRDEAASNLLLDAMPSAQINQHELPKAVVIFPDLYRFPQLFVRDPDRKAAVRAAFIAWMDRQ